MTVDVEKSVNFSTKKKVSLTAAAPGSKLTKVPQHSEQRPIKKLIEKLSVHKLMLTFF